MLGSLYGAAASRRRRWYARHPARVRRLGRPVISVGNLRAGGSGKTPVVACLARLLVERGERPAILSRGYARPRPLDGVTVVSDGRRIMAGFETSGDEPLMLARTLPAVPVLVCADRFLAGRLAERQFGATVHLLDDGFQHVQLARAVDLLLVDEADLEDRLIPAGTLREPLSSASAADALLVTASGGAGASRVAATLGAERVFTVARAMLPPQWLNGGVTEVPRDPVFAFAAIAKPSRFFADLTSRGWSVAGTRAFRDHHAYTPRDMRGLAEAARRAGASTLVTTEKDAARFSGSDVAAMKIAVVPLQAAIEPADAFVDWLISAVPLLAASTPDLPHAPR